MPFPVHDWQFWMVTALAAGAVVYVFRGVLFSRGKRRGTRKRTTLTIGGKSPDPKGRV